MTPHASRFTDDEPVALAKHAIGLLQDKLARDHGLKVVMGAELEFKATTHDPTRVPSPRMLGVPDDKKAKKQGVVPSAARGYFNRDPWFPHSRRVAYSYREYAAHPGMAIMEVVLTHRPTDKDGTPLPHQPFDLARDVEALRYQLLDPAPGYKEKPGLLGFQQRGTEKWQSVRRNKLDDLGFARFVPEADGHETATFGLHLNSHLEEIATGENRFTNKAWSMQNYIPLTRAVFDEGLYLLTPSQAAWDRLAFQTQGFVPEFDIPVYARNVTPGEKGDEPLPYLENKLPGADSNPYYAVMLQLVAYERAAQLDDKGLSLYPPQMIAPKTPEEMHERFARGSLRAQLNALEDGLGDRFYSAVERCPPGTERTAMDKRHDSPGVARQ